MGKCNERMESMTNPLREIEKGRPYQVQHGCVFDKDDNFLCFTHSDDEAQWIALALNTPASQAGEGDDLQTGSWLERLFEEYRALVSALNDSKETQECEELIYAVKREVAPPSTPSPQASAPESPALEALIEAYNNAVDYTGGFHGKVYALKLVDAARAEATRRTESAIHLATISAILTGHLDPEKLLPGDLECVAVQDAVRAVRELEKRRTVPVDVRKCAEEILSYCLKQEGSMGLILRQIIEKHLQKGLDAKGPVNPKWIECPDCRRSLPHDCIKVIGAGDGKTREGE